MERLKARPANTLVVPWLAMSGQGEQHDVTCPHCRKPFTAPVLGGGAHQGFKCPHCRLFVPLERAEEQKLAESRGA